MLERPAPYRSVRAAETAEPVGVVAEQVRVDGTDPKPLVLGRRAQLVPVVDSIPRNVDGDGWTAAGELVHERRVRDSLVDVARSAGPGVDVEPRAGVAVSPRR